jgi:hypothetical protein
VHHKTPKVNIISNCEATRSKKEQSKQGFVYETDAARVHAWLSIQIPNLTECKVPKS